jgi:hypothetical protein
MAHHVSGTIEDYDVAGEGTCLTTSLIAYAEDCRRAAARHTQCAEALMAEALRAERAATAVECEGK